MMPGDDNTAHAAFAMAPSGDSNNDQFPDQSEGNPLDSMPEDQPHFDQENQHRRLRESSFQRESQDVAFPWQRHVEWMNQAQQIPPEQFPQVNAPVVYEGYMPDNVPFLSQTSSSQFPWPVQKVPPPAKPSRVSINHHFSRHTHLGRLTSPAYQTPPVNIRNQQSRQASIIESHHGTSSNAQSVHHNSNPAYGSVPVTEQQSQYPPLPPSPYSLHDEHQPWSSSEANLGNMPRIGAQQADNGFTNRVPTEVLASNNQPHDLSDDSFRPEYPLWNRMTNSNEISNRHVPDNLALTQISPSLQERNPRNRTRGNKTGKRGRPRKSSKDRRDGPRQALDPGEEFNRLHAEATEALIVRQDHNAALGFILEAISINPEIISAHVMLSEIYFAQGENEKAIAALFSGAHAAPNDAGIWSQVADICLQRSKAEREVVLKQVVYCYTRLLNMDQEDHEARFQRAVINRELGYSTKALKDLEIILKVMPYNASILKEYAELCLDIDRVERAKELYDVNLEQVRSGALTDPQAFTWAHLIVYVDLVLHDEGIARAISVLKETGRWLLGRAEESFWNLYVDDDREWDSEDNPRRLAAPQYLIGRHPIEAYGAALPLELRIKLAELRLSQGRQDEAIVHYEWLEPETVDEGANIYEYPDLFLESAHSLREAKQYKQALRYYNALLKINAEFEGDDAVKFWQGVGACSYVCNEKQNALQYYENVKTIDPHNVEAHTQLSKLYADRGQRDTALRLARDALAFHEKALPKTGNRKYERKELREARQAAQAAYKAAYKMPKTPGNQDAGPAPSFSRREREKARRLERELQGEKEDELVPEDREQQQTPRPKRRLTKKQRTKEQQEQHVRHLYTVLCSKTEAMRDGDDEARSIWLECAEALIEDFRSNKIFYPPERYKTFQGYNRPHARKPDSVDTLPDDGTSLEVTTNEDVPLPSIESSIPVDYSGIVFTSWLDVFLEYALLLANLQYESSECYAVITAAIDCIVWYHNTDAMTQIHMCYIACCLALQDETTLFNVALRWFMREFAFCTDVYRLFCALNFYYPHTADRAGRMGQMANAKFRGNANQKFVFRHVSALDSYLPDDYGVDTPYGPVPEFARRERNEAAQLQSLQAGRNSIQNNIASQQGRPSSQSAITRSISTPDALLDTATPHVNQSNNSRSDTRTLQPQEMNVVLLTLYGQILYAGASFPSALSYFYRAHSLDPDNAMVLLSLTLCYMHQMFKRQNENRHMYLLQGWALFEEYAQARMKYANKMIEKGFTSSIVGTVKREIEFNRSRCWQMVGLADLAVRGYERMMGIKNIKTEEDVDMDVDADNGDDKNTNDYDMEAAYALATMYAVNGDSESAREITEKWLMVE